MKIKAFFILRGFIEADQTKFFRTWESNFCKIEMNSFTCKDLLIQNLLDNILRQDKEKLSEQMTSWIFLEKSNFQATE